MTLRRKLIGHFVVVLIIVLILLGLTWGVIRLTELSAAIAFTLVAAIFGILYWTWKPEIRRWFSEKNQPKLNITLASISPEQQVKRVELWLPSGERRYHDARHLFQMARNRAGKKPQVLITDGLKSYNEACNFEYWTPKMETRTVHIRHITLRGEHHNNKMERMNGEIRDREKVTRNIKTENSPILRGLQLYHNYVRPHMGLDGKTPADLAGIEVQGENKWLTLIQNATRDTKARKERLA